MSRREVANLRIVPYDDSAGTAEGRGLAPETYSDFAFFEFRNAILAALRPFGTVGPMGASPLDGSPLPLNGPLECAEPDFYVVDDRWNEEQMLVSVEVPPERLSFEVLQAIVSMLATRPGWVVQFALFRDGDFLGGVQILSDCAMVGGDLLQGCTTLSDVARACVR